MRLHLHRHAVAGIAALLFAVPSLAKDEPAEATVVCKDGSTAKGGRGACRGHGGVDKAASAKAAGASAAAAGETRGKEAKESAEKRAAKASDKADEKAAEATVVCKDGSSAKGGRGACRGHGGVDRAATAKAAGTAAVPSAAPPAPAAAAPRAPAPPTQAVPPAPPAPPSQAAPPAAAATQRAPKASEDARPPIARCKDGTFSHAAHHTGACSNHGGVAEWLDKEKK